MSEDNHPSIPQIVRALVTLEDRHSTALREQREKHSDALKAKERSLAHASDIIDRRGLQNEVLKGVIENLCSRITRTAEQLRHDNRDAVYSEPLALLNLLGREVDPQTLMQRAMAKAMSTPASIKAVQDAEADPADADPSICQYACTHKASSHRERGCRWEACACKAPGPGLSSEVFCRVCGHSEERHTRSLPEEGGKAYCTECSWADEYHELDNAPAHPDDRCNCGCPRSAHQDEQGLGGAQCRVCPEDGERSWRHAFRLRP